MNQNQTQSDQPFIPRGGYSMLTTYQKCQRAFWFRYVKRWIPTETNQKQAWGRVLHAVTGAITVDPEQDLYNLYDSTVVLEGLTDTDLINRGFKLFQKWFEEIHPEDRNSSAVLIDQMLGVDVDGFEFLIKPDRVLFDRITNKHILFEIKTTGYSLDAVAGNLTQTDQVTGYLWGWNRKFNTDLHEVIPEIFYSRGGVHRIERRAPIYRSTSDLLWFEEYLRYWCNEISYKLKSDAPEESYPRCFSCTEGSNFKCDYQEICRITHEASGMPLGYKLKEEFK